MFANPKGWHVLNLPAVTLLPFGAAKLPSSAGSVGYSTRILRAEAKMDIESAPTAEGSINTPPTLQASACVLARESVAA